MHCCLSSSAAVTWTCHNVTCTLHILLCSGLHLTYTKGGFLHCDCLLYPVCTESCQQMKIPVADGENC